METKNKYMYKMVKLPVKILTFNVKLSVYHFKWIETLFGFLV